MAIAFRVFWFFGFARNHVETGPYSQQQRPGQGVMVHFVIYADELTLEAMVENMESCRDLGRLNGYWTKSLLLQQSPQLPG